MAGQPNATYVMTRDGRMVTLDSGVPSLTDIAVSLSRMPRFAGNTSIPWTVLDHSLYVERLAHRYAGFMQLDRQQERSLRLAAMLHDAHEAVTGDIPTAFKTDDIRAIQKRLDKRLMQEYYPGGNMVFEAWKDHVAAFDRRALLAEGIVVGPFAYTSDAGMRLHFGETPDDGAVEVLREGLLMQRFGPQAQYPYESADESPNVQRFIRLYAELR